ncbi:MAG TPA: SpoIIE family protein phosphatase [Candidatus Polarisedimenticolaceae bacterium]|nr:SpoIIE family protein phosphatase [Candidatus Polarisedimenticolaceae bacterium]
MQQAEPDLSGAWFREQLLARRRRLADVPRRREFEALIGEVDAALERLDRGTFGACERCHDPIEARRLFGDPSTRVCLGCLTDAQQRALERDLESAAAAQRALLPRPLVSVAGWEIAHRYLPFGPVSGDYCDVLRPDPADGTTWFVLGDVAGKGVAASILMGHLQALFRALVTVDPSPAELARRANRILCEGVLAGAFSTLLLGRMRPDGEVEICNAGHEPARLVRRDGVTALGATGLPLGLFGESGYDTVRFRMAAGDCLLLYSDGMSEAVNGRGEAYGAKRLDAFVGRVNGDPAGSVLDQWLDDLDTFCADAARQDDLTVMLVRRREEAGGMQ